MFGGNRENNINELTKTMHAIKHKIANQIPSHGWPDEKPVVAYRKEISLVRSLLVIIKN